MFRFLLPAILFFAASAIRAQFYDNKGQFCISAGMTVPVADFASTDTNNIGAGYARPGFSGYLLPQIRLSDFLGFAGLMGYARNPYNSGDMEDQYRVQHPSQQYTFSADAYSMLSFMGGLSLTVPQGNIDLSLKGYVGLAVALLPATSAVFYPDQAGDPLLELQTDKNRTSAFSYGGGVEILYYASEKVGITFNALYLHSNPEFNAVGISVYENGELTVLSGIDLQQKFQVISLGLGVAFMF